MKLVIINCLANVLSIGEWGLSVPSGLRDPAIILKMVVLPNETQHTLTKHRLSDCTPMSYVKKKKLSTTKPKSFSRSRHLEV